MGKRHELLDTACAYAGLAGDFVRAVGQGIGDAASDFCWTARFMGRDVFDIMYDTLAPVPPPNLSYVDLDAIYGPDGLKPISRGKEY